MARRGGQGNRGRRSSRNRSRSRSTKSSSRSTSSSRGRRGGQGNRKKFGRAKGTVSRKSIGKSLRSVKKAASRVRKGIGRSLRGAAANAASFAANHPSLSSYNKRTRDMSKLTPQQRRRYQRLSEKTGRDYSQRIPSMNINLSADRLAQLGGFADSRFYKGLTKAIPGIKSLQINKQLYSNPMKDGWHSSQRTGRGSGLTHDYFDPYEADKEWYDKYNPQGVTVSQARKRYANQLKEGVSLEQAMRSNKAETLFFDALIPDKNEPVKNLPSLRADPSQDIGKMYQNILGREADQEGLDYWTNEFRSGRQNMDDIRRQLVQSDEFEGRFPDTKIGLPYFPDGAPPQVDPDEAPPQVEAPKDDWLGAFYNQYNIGGRGGNLDQEARDYWTNEAKTKGRKAVLDTIRNTAKNQGTWGGRSAGKPGKQRIDTGRTPPWFGRGPKTGKPNRRGRPSPRIGHWGIGIPGHAGDMISGHVGRKGKKRKANLQNKGAKRRMAKSLAAHMAAKGGIG